MRPGQLLIGFAEPLTATAATRAVAERRVVLAAMELVPRITRAQSMDALSSMATIVGYKAVLLAATTLPRMFPMLNTAAGTVSAARVFVVGAGVAGLQAIATSRRLGARVEAYDVRPDVKEQIQSLGARFVELPIEVSNAQDQGGYATAQDESFYRRQREMMMKTVANTDIVITTAAIPGKKAPILVTAEMVAAMPAGSVIVDLAAERGGNCELTVPDEVVVRHGVTILGPTNLAATVPYHASQMYARNVVTLIQHLVHREKGPDGKATGAPRLTLNMDDEITKEIIVTKDGRVVHARVRELEAVT
jgi:NAD(P) transhydrogenase subunit alpha